jgi:DNA-binding beta-propeller fold protein YncE
MKIFWFFSLAVALCDCTVFAQSTTLRLTHTIPLPGVTGRFDHFAIDSNGKRLFVAALGNNTLEVFDVARFERAGTIKGLRKPTGVAFLPQMGRLFVANGDDGTLRAYDTKTLGPAGTVSSLDDADNLRFDTNANRLYVGHGDGALGVIDPAALRVVSTIKLRGHPESFQLEPGGRRIFINIPGARQIAVVDRDAQRIIAEWPMTTSRANFPMSFDAQNRRLFVGCRQPPRLVILDTDSGRPVADLPISGDTDDLFYDSKLSRIYISCGEGFIDIIEQKSANTYARLERVATTKGARTSFFSPELRQFYLAVPEHEGKPATLQVYSVGD